MVYYAKDLVHDIKNRCYYNLQRLFRIFFCMILTSYMEKIFIPPWIEISMLTVSFGNNIIYVL
jgi:hypothetical protein